MRALPTGPSTTPGGALRVSLLDRSRVMLEAIVMKRIANHILLTLAALGAAALTLVGIHRH